MPYDNVFDRGRLPALAPLLDAAWPTVGSLEVLRTFVPSAAPPAAPDCDSSPLPAPPALPPAPAASILLRSCEYIAATTCAFFLHTRRKVPLPTLRLGVQNRASVVPRGRERTARSGIRG